MAAAAVAAGRTNRRFRTGAGRDSGRGRSGTPSGTISAAAAIDGTWGRRNASSRRLGSTSTSSGDSSRGSSSLSFTDIATALLRSGHGATCSSVLAVDNIAMRYNGATIGANYHLKPGYVERLEPEYWLDEATEVLWQPDVYLEAAALAGRLGARRIVDVGCGYGEKIGPYRDEFEIVGIDFGSNIAACR